MGPCPGANPFFAANVSQIGAGGLHGRAAQIGRLGGGPHPREATGVPVGLGEPLFDKLDADIAYAMMGINAVKGVEIGAGFGAVSQRGSEHGDELTPTGFASNNAGGVLGGISTGQDLVAGSPSSPPARSACPEASIDRAGSLPWSDLRPPRPCVGIRATPIAEAMLALVLMDHALRHRAPSAGTWPWPLRPLLQPSLTLPLTLPLTPTRHAAIGRGRCRFVGWVRRSHNTSAGTMQAFCQQEICMNCGNKKGWGWVAGWPLPLASTPPSTWASGMSTKA